MVFAGSLRAATETWGEPRDLVWGRYCCMPNSWELGSSFRGQASIAHATCQQPNHRLANRAPSMAASKTGMHRCA